MKTLRALFLVTLCFCCVLGGGGSCAAQAAVSANTESSPTESAPESGPTESAEDKYIAVEAEGRGETKLQALKAAWAEAVRLGIDIYLISKPTVVDDDLQEEIILHSRGQANSYEELAAARQADGWHVRIRAKIERDILQDAADLILNKRETVAVDPNSAAEYKISAEDKKLAALALVNAFPLHVKLEDFLDYDFSTEQEQGELKIIHQVKLNMKRYTGFKDSVFKLVDKIAIKKQERAFTKASIQAGRDMKKTVSVYGQNNAQAPCEPETAGDAKAGQRPYVYIAKDEISCTLYELEPVVYEAVRLKFAQIFLDRGGFARSIAFRVNALDAGNNLVDSQRSGKMLIYRLGCGLSSEGIMIAPYARFDETYFQSMKIPMTWENMQSGALANAKALKCSFEIE
jgi:hypothetical protein